MPARTELKKRKGYRELHIGKYTWQWKVGKKYVCIYNVLGQKDTPTKYEVAGVSEGTVGVFPITPAHIMNYITRTQLNNVIHLN